MEKRKRKPVRFFIRSSRVLVSRINEPRAFILLLKRPFECAKRRESERESAVGGKGAWVVEST